MLVLVVPYHNEERYLPLLIESLRRQSATDIPVVFADNASTDAGASLVERCPEVAAGRWLTVAEPKIGKFHAMSMATNFCAERLGARWVGFVDADSHWLDDDWLGTWATIIREGGHDLG